MKILWSENAQRDMDSIFEYLSERHLLAAIDLLDTIYQSITLLAENPRMGRKSRNGLARELVIPSTNYIITYDVSENYVELLRVYHGRQNWKR